MMRVLACLLLSACFAAEAKVTAGEQPPDRIGKDRHGELVTVSGNRGKVLIVTFWASWCGPCRQELPILERLQRIAGHEALRVVAVNFKEDRRTYRRMLRDFEDAAITMVHDARGKTSDAYGVSALPHMFLVDHTGTVAHTHRGYSVEMLDGFIAEVNALLRARHAAQDVQAAP